MGVVAGISLLFSIARVKFAAIYLGVVGVAHNATLGSLQNLCSTLTGLGIQSSAVREICVANEGDNKNLSSVLIITIRAICWISGLISLFLMISFSMYISFITFDTNQYALEISLLGVAVLLGNIASGELAVLQSARRIKEIATINLLNSMLTTVVAAYFYIYLGLPGIILTILAGSLSQLLLSWYYVKKLSLNKIKFCIEELLPLAKPLIKLGSIFMLTGLTSSIVSYITIILVVKMEGVVNLGMYSAAFALSGFFVNIILTAMGTDYYPRLISAMNDRPLMVELINKQTEIGILLSLPAIIGSISLAPWLLKVFYSDEFSQADVILQWLILGCLGRVISWPMGFILPALGKSKLMLFSEIGIHLMHLLLIYVGLLNFGIIGVGYAFSAIYAVHIILMRFIAGNLIDFKWSSKSILLMSVTLSLSIIIHIFKIQMNNDWTLFIGTSITCLVLLFSSLVLLGNNFIRAK